MGLIKCADCGKLFSDRIQACPECGCPIEFCLDDKQEITTDSLPKEKDYFASACYEKLDLDLGKYKTEMTEILAPLLEKKYRINQVKLQMVERGQAWASRVSNRAALLIREYMEKSLTTVQDDIHQEILAYQKNVTAALRQYKDRQENVTVTGLGFDIITNDSISMLSYSVLNYHDAKKQIKQQLNAADEMLHKKLQSLPGDEKLSSDCLDRILTMINDTALMLSDFVVARNTLAEVYDFYGNFDKYKNSTSVTKNKDLISHLFKAYSDDDFIGTWKFSLDGTEKKTIASLAADGYLFINERSHYYVTSGKLETSVLNGEPKNDSAVENAEDSPEAALYEQADAAEAGGRYYEAAVKFAQCQEYRDSFERSANIWDHHLANREYLVPGVFGALALTADGTVRQTGFKNERTIYGSYLLTNGQHQPSILTYDKKLYAPSTSTMKEYDLSAVIPGEVEEIAAFQVVNNRYLCLMRDGVVICNTLNNGAEDHWEREANTWRNIKKAILTNSNIVALDICGNIYSVGADAYKYASQSDSGKIKDFTVLNEGIALLMNDGQIQNWNLKSYCSFTGVKDVTHFDGIFGVTATRQHYRAAGFQTGQSLADLRKYVVIRLSDSINTELLMNGEVVSDRGLLWDNMVWICNWNNTVFGVCADGQIKISNDEYKKMEDVAQWRLFDHIDRWDSAWEKGKHEFPELRRQDGIKAMEAEIIGLCEYSTRLLEQISECKGFMARGKKKNLEELLAKNEEAIRLKKSELTERFGVRTEG